MILTVIGIITAAAESTVTGPAGAGGVSCIR